MLLRTGGRNSTSFLLASPDGILWGYWAFLPKTWDWLRPMPGGSLPDNDSFLAEAPSWLIIQPSSRNYTPSFQELSSSLALCSSFPPPFLSLCFLTSALGRPSQIFRRKPHLWSSSNSLLTKSTKEIFFSLSLSIITSAIGSQGILKEVRHTFQG